MYQNYYHPHKTLLGCIKMPCRNNYLMIRYIIIEILSKILLAQYIRLKTNKQLNYQLQNY